MYEKLARGEISDEEEKEKYCVDFFQKSIARDEYEQPESQDTRGAEENEDGENDDNVLLNSKPFGPGRTSVAVDSDEHKRFVRYGLFLLVPFFQKGLIAVRLPIRK